jgi:hypothetical protein
MIALAPQDIAVRATVATRETVTPGYEGDASAETPWYKNPVTYAVAGGGVLAAIGGYLLLGSKRKRR